MRNVLISLALAASMIPFAAAQSFYGYDKEGKTYEASGIVDDVYGRPFEVEDGRKRIMSLEAFTRNSARDPRAYWFLLKGGIMLKGTPLTETWDYFQIRNQDGNVVRIYKDQIVLRELSEDDD